MPCWVVRPHTLGLSKAPLLFMQKYRDIKDLLWCRKCIFGRATDHWQRIEFQNRGALHVPRFSSTKSTTVERDGATRRENLNCASTGSRTSYRIGTVSLTVGCVTITPGLSGRTRECLGRSYRPACDAAWPGEIFGQVCVKSGAHLYDQSEGERE